MASFTLVGLDTAAKTLNNGEFGYITEAGELVVSATDTIVGSGSNRLVVNGTLAQVNAVDISLVPYDFDGVLTTVIIGQNGSVISAMGNALDLAATSLAEVYNSGTILADGIGINVNETDGQVDVRVNNSGTINAVNGVVANAGSGVINIVNSGDILTLGVGIFSSGSGDVSLSNSGAISTSTSNAVVLGTGDDTFVNTGTVLGNIVMGGGDDKFDGRNGVQGGEAVVLGSGNDTFLGGTGAEGVSDGDGADEVRAGAGDDTIVSDGDLADDLFDGGDGVDLIVYGAFGDDLSVNLATGFATGGLIGADQLVSIEHVKTGTGDDTVIGNSDNNLIRTGDGADRALGDDGRDRILGGEGDDTLFGGAGNDRLFGGEDNDRLLGNDGNDVLIGGLGRDVMTGGAGFDHFVFLDIADSGITAGTRDTITDFEQGIDKIDLSAIDAVPGTAIDDAFTFIGTSAFSGSDEELRYRNTATLTIVEVDQDGDGTADLEIRLNGVITLAQTDFVL